MVLNCGKQPNSEKTQTNLFNGAQMAELIHFLEIDEVLELVRAKVVG